MIYLIKLDKYKSLSALSSSHSLHYSFWTHPIFFQVRSFKLCTAPPPTRPSNLAFALSNWGLSQTANISIMLLFFFFNPPSKFIPWALKNTRWSRHWEVLEMLGQEWEGFICRKDVNCHGRMYANTAINSSRVSWLYANSILKTGRLFLFPLNLGWPCDCDSFWPIERSEDATVQPQT